jgi:DNA/RNA endonuclease YhcR with UshA esterase domain
LQLNLTAGSWPAITLGDIIRVQGSVSQTKTYGTRLNISSADDITVLDKSTIPEPLTLEIKELTSSNEGSLIRASGQITANGNNWFDLTADGNKLRINLKNQELNWPKLTKGRQLTITGLITLSQGDLRLWPRMPDDIIVSAPSISTSQENIDLSQKHAADWRGYIIIGGLMAILGTSWWWQKKKLPSPWQLTQNWLNNLKPRV